MNKWNDRSRKVEVATRSGPMRFKVFLLAFLLIFLFGAWLFLVYRPSLSLLTDKVAQVKVLLTAHKKSQKVVAQKQKAHPISSEQSPIEFEFYAVLPNMQVNVNELNSESKRTPHETKSSR